MCSDLARHLHIFLRFCASVDATAGGVSHVDLLACARELEVSGWDHDMHLQRLSLRNNRFLSHCDHPWLLLLSQDVSDRSDGSDSGGDDPWGQFACKLLTRCSRLESLDVTGCATTAAQAAVLAAGLAGGLKARRGSRLKEVVARGLHSLHTTTCNLMKAELKDEATGLLTGVERFDLLGAHNSL